MRATVDLPPTGRHRSTAADAGCRTDPKPWPECRPTNKHDQAIPRQLFNVYDGLNRSRRATLSRGTFVDDAENPRLFRSRLYQVLPSRSPDGDGHPMSRLGETMTAQPAHDDADSPWSVAADAFVAWRDEGRAEGLDRLVQVVTPTLWHMTRAYGLREEETKDVIQSTWQTLVTERASIREPRAVWRWITVTCRRLAAKTARRGRREEPVELKDLDRRTPDDVVPDSVVLRNDAADRLWRHVATLSERCRRLLRIIAFDIRPDYQALAAEMGMPVGSIGPNRGRCLKKLHQLLDADPGWSDR
jgi:RNA polymerase sigma factor (sigma-70 family)